MKIYTIGYEGCEIEDFLKSLKKQKITCIADVRKTPASRKRGFSKRLLAEHLAKAHIEYRHFGNLGVPSAWRKEAKAHLITREKMFRDYARKILPKEHPSMQELLSLAKGAKTRMALLCYESDAGDCHRSFLARHLQKLAKVQVVDLVADSPSPGMFKRSRKTASQEAGHKRP